MTPERWEQINQLYYAALDVEEKERSCFLEQACGNNPELRSEVESLLNMHAQVDGFLGTPAMEEVAKALKAEPPSLVGRRLGPYQIIGVLGAGGMGEVYQARDTRLNRTVAIKVLPRHLSERTDLRQRFEREARAIASLDHPHICALYDIGHEGATDFLVMQYLEGETLSQRLKRGSLPTEEVLRYAIEIAGALDKAHRHGVIHRDLKPGNIMLTETGAKLLDFGLAKQERPPLTRVDYKGVETASESLTEEGMLLGTLEYMAPEQLEGKEADARTDIFALGVVIYEIATGRRAFEGDSKASLIAKILTTQPPSISTIEPVSPPELDRVVQRCLAKKPEERWQSAAELKSELRGIEEKVLARLKAQKGGEATEIRPEPSPVLPTTIPELQNIWTRLIRSRAWILGFVGILVTVGIVALVVWQARQQQPEKLKEMTAKPLTSYSMDNPLMKSAAISPDGKYLAFCSQGKLFIQIIRSGEKRSVLLPEGFYTAEVSWFPDGTKLLLSRDEDSKQKEAHADWLPGDSLWFVSILGGNPQKIAEDTIFPSVSPDGSLVAFSRGNSERHAADLWVVGTNGEGPRRIRTPSNEVYWGPVWSSNGQRLFYVRDNGKAHWLESCDLHGKQVTTIFPSKEGHAYDYDWEGIQSLCWAPDGRILFSMKLKGLLGPAANLWEIKVDASTGRPLSEARRITDWTNFSTVNVGSLSITSDGKQLAVLRENAQSDVYVAELGPGRKTMKNPRRLTLNEKDDVAWDWTADSRAVLFDSSRNGNNDLFKQDISQMEAETILASPEQERHPGLSPDGAFILYLVSEKPGPNATRLMRVPVGGGPPELVLRGEKIKNFSCAREANLCVVAEEVEGKQILTTFDPEKGRGQKLPPSDYPKFERGILSPQGRLIDKMKSGPDGLYIRVRSMKGGPAEEFTFKDLTGGYGFSGWSVDGKGVYLGERTTSDFRVLYAGLNGESHVIWKRGSSPGLGLDNPIPSPDGRYLAFTIVTGEANAWLLENF